jgi:hypothetical protein
MTPTPKASLSNSGPKAGALSRIAKQLNIAQRSLVDWYRQEHEQIRALWAIECEALQEKILATHEHQLVRLKTALDRVETELAKRTVEFVSTENLYRLSAPGSGRNPQSLPGPQTAEKCPGPGGVRITTVSASFLPHQIACLPNLNLILGHRNPNLPYLEQTGFFLASPILVYTKKTEADHSSRPQL